MQKFDINSYITTEGCTIFQGGNKNRGEYLLFFFCNSLTKFDDSGGTPFVKVPVANKHGQIFLEQHPRLNF